MLKLLTVVEVNGELGVILPDEVLERLGVVEGDTLYLDATETSILLSGRDKHAEAEKIAKSVLERDAEALSELAKK